MRNLVGSVRDQVCLGGVAGARASVRCWVSEFGFGFEVLGDDLVWSPTVHHALLAGVVGRVEAAQHLFEGTVRVDVDAEHLTTDPAVEALDHAFGLGRSGTGVPIVRAQLGADFGKGGREAAAVVGQHGGKLERKGAGRLAQEGDGALLGFVVLDREVDGARAAVDGNIQEALAPLAVAELQLGQVLDVDADDAEVVVAERALALGRLVEHGLGPSVQAFGLEDAPDAVAVEVRQEVADDEGEVVEWEVGAAPQGADYGALFLSRLPG